MSAIIASNYLKEKLGYKSSSSFQALIHKAHQEFALLEQPVQREIDYLPNNNHFELSHSAVYLITQLAQDSKPQVVAVKEAFNQYSKDYPVLKKLFATIHRLKLRDMLSDANRSLSGLVHERNLVDFVSFNQASYLGLYNMLDWELVQHRKLEKDEPLEYMSVMELTIQLLRSNTTYETILLQNETGQLKLEHCHINAARLLRTYIENQHGITPESFAQETFLEELKTDMRNALKALNTLELPEILML